MTDNKKERTIRDILSDEVERQLEKNPPAKPSFEEFREMAYRRMKNDKEGDDASEEGDNIMPVETKNIKRILRTAGVAAGFVMAVLAGMFAMNSLNSEVGADKNPKEEIVTEDGVIIEDGGWGSDDGEDNVWVVEDWDDVADVKKVYPVFLIPEYIPKGYMFEKLIIENFIDNDIKCEYYYETEMTDIMEIELIIQNSNLMSLEMDNIIKEVESSKGKIYIQANEKKATIQIDDGIIVIVSGDVSDNELVKLVEGLSY